MISAPLLHSGNIGAYVVQFIQAFFSGNVQHKIRNWAHCDGPMHLSSMIGR